MTVIMERYFSKENITLKTYLLCNMGTLTVIHLYPDAVMLVD